jgi:hypothetical protein
MKKPVYQVIRIQQKPSKINGGFYYLITLQDIKTQRCYETSIDPAYRNFHNWSQVIEDQHKGQLLSNLNISVKGGKEIVNADSIPQQEFVTDRETLLNQLDQWRNPSRALFE